MMKIFRFAILALLLVAGTAVAATITVDFSGLSTTTDITFQGDALNPDLNSVHLNGPNGVRIQYVAAAYDTGTGLPIDTASADNTGVFGSPLGALVLIFDNPAVGLSFDYSVDPFLDAEQLPLPVCVGGNCVDLIFNPGNILASSLDPLATFTYGSLAGPAASPFSAVTIFFASDAANFNMSNIKFDSTAPDTVPEPGTFVLIGSCLLGLAGTRLLKRRA